jgi:hypothetical protein
VLKISAQTVQCELFNARLVPNVFIKKSVDFQTFLKKMFLETGQKNKSQSADFQPEL